MEILRLYFASRSMSPSWILLAGVDLANVDGRRLLSGLHGNTSVTRLDLDNVGLEGQTGGEALSELLQRIPHMATLKCKRLQLGVEGTRALQPSIRTNRTMQVLGLEECDLGDEGASLIVDALGENRTVKKIILTDNGITSNGLPHLTRLLLRRPSLTMIHIDDNRGLFDNEANTNDFCMALQNSQVTNLNLNFCQLTSHVIAALFQALSVKKRPTLIVGVYDYDQIQGAYLVPLLEIIPQMRNLSALCVNIDFMNESVLSSFHRNTSVFRLYKDNSTRSTLRVKSWSEIESGAVTAILKRNRWLDSTSTLLASSEPQQTVPLGLWSKAMERLTHDDSTGVTAIYKIMQEKVVMWVFPYQEAVEATMMASLHSPVSSTTTETDAVGITTVKNDDSNEASSMTNDTTTTNNNSTVVLKKRSYAQGNNPTVGDDDNDDKASPRKKPAC